MRSGAERSGAERRRLTEPPEGESPAERSGARYLEGRRGHGVSVEGRSAAGRRPPDVLAVSVGAEVSVSEYRAE